MGSVSFKLFFPPKNPNVFSLLSHLPFSNLTDPQPPRQRGRLLAGSLPQLASLPSQQRAVPQPHGSAEEAARGQAAPLFSISSSLSAFFSSISISMFVCFLVFKPHCCGLFVFTRHVIASLSLSHTDTCFFPAICRSVWPALSSL